MTHRPLCTAAASLIACFASLSAQEFKAPVEETNYRAGPTMYDPLMKFVYELEARSDLMSVQQITKTLRGREFAAIRGRI